MLLHARFMLKRELVYSGLVLKAEGCHTDPMEKT